MAIPGKLNTDYTAGDARSLSTAVNDLGSVVQGDTGWRDIATLLASGWSASKFWLKRSADEVVLLVEGLKGPGGGWATATVSPHLPVGFRPPTPIQLSFITGDTNQSRRSAVSAVGQLQFLGSIDLTVSSHLAVCLRWPTRDAFPAASGWPGTAVA